MSIISSSKIKCERKQYLANITKDSPLHHEEEAKQLSSVAEQGHSGLIQWTALDSSQPRMSTS